MITEKNQTLKKKLAVHEYEKLANMRLYGFGPEVMKVQKVCKVCGSTCGKDDDYCPACGTVLPGETLFELYRLYHISCPSCQTVVHVAYHYCPICGKQLKKPM